MARSRSAALTLLADASTGLRRRDGVVYGAERDRPHEIGGCTGAGQAGHALKDWRVRTEAPIPYWIDRSEWREAAVKACLAGRASITVPSCAPVTCHARGALDESIFRHRVANADIETHVVHEVRLRRLETIVDEGGIPLCRSDHGGQRGGLSARWIATTGLAVGWHDGLRGAKLVVTAEDIATRRGELVLQRRPRPIWDELADDMPCHQRLLLAVVPGVHVKCPRHVRGCDPIEREGRNIRNGKPICFDFDRIDREGQAFPKSRA